MTEWLIYSILGIIGIIIGLIVLFVIIKIISSAIFSSYFEEKIKHHYLKGDYYGKDEDRKEK